MARDSDISSIAFRIMAAVTVFNILLSVNFISAGGAGLASFFNGQSIFLLGGAEAVLVLLAYVVSTNRPVPLPV
jgi:hypothetical protein